MMPKTAFGAFFEPNRGKSVHFLFFMHIAQKRHFRKTSGVLTFYRFCAIMMAVQKNTAPTLTTTCLKDPPFVRGATATRMEHGTTLLRKPNREYWIYRIARGKRKEASPPVAQHCDWITTIAEATGSTPTACRLKV